MAARTKAPQAPGRDDALNDRIQGLLREAAEKLAERTRTQAAADADAAGRQLDEILSLARGRDRSDRSDRSGHSARG